MRIRSGRRFIAAIKQTIPLNETREASMSVSTEQHWIETSNGLLFAQSWTPPHTHSTALILLHDSLGCVELWRDFPEQLALLTSRRVIAYDRLGFGRSAATTSKLPLSFVEDEALGDFATLLDYFQLWDFIVFGHSVGGGMAIGCAAAYPQACKAVISESAQAFVEDRTLAGIRQAKTAFAAAEQLQRLAKYHGDKTNWVLSAWIDTWLADNKRDWNLDSSLRQVHSPLLCLHGDQDEYGSNAHPQRIQQQLVDKAHVHILTDCGHVPHREQQKNVLNLVSEFLQTLGD
jgi:pimeloyl-ACP methyl ester carboxylesterase